MDFEKPNYRPQRRSHSTYEQRLAKRDQQNVLTVSTTSSAGSHVTARGESFGQGCEYSMDKARRWELKARDFEPAAEADSDLAIAVARVDKGRKSQLRKVQRAFDYRYENGPVDVDQEEDSSISSRKSTSKKDRKHFSASKPKLNKKMANSHSSETYAIASADVLVTLQEVTPTIKPYRLYRHHQEKVARAHKYTGTIEV